MRADKRCTASGRALQVKSAASEIQRVKIHLGKLCKIKVNAYNQYKYKSYNKTICGREFYEKGIPVQEK